MSQKLYDTLKGNLITPSLRGSSLPRKVPKEFNCLIVCQTKPLPETTSSLGYKIQVILQVCSLDSQSSQQKHLFRNILKERITRRKCYEIWHIYKLVITMHISR